jgi:hypothetical protein
VACCASSAVALDAQQPPPPVLAPYRAPVIALVQPPDGGTVPQDKPVVVFRFAPGEPDDPIDAASFALSVDGENRTSLFQLSAAEAWGPLAAVADRASSLGLGAHLVEARVCSAKGACAALSASVISVPGVHGDPPTPSSRRARLLDVLIRTTRKLLAP